MKTYKTTHCTRDVRKDGFVLLVGMRGLGEARGRNGAGDAKGMEALLQKAQAASCLASNINLGIERASTITTTIYNQKVKSGMRHSSKRVS